MSPEAPTVKQCCAAFYGSDLARFLLGDNFHPGGTDLTKRLGQLLGLSQESRVLDVASGLGASAFCLAESFGCHITGVDLSEENIRLSNAAAGQRGLAERVTFQLADAERLPFADAAFDAIVCECAFCTFPDKLAAAREFFRVLKPGGQVGLSDLTRSAEPLPELDGLLAWIACIGDALPVARYQAILADAGLEVRITEDHDGTLVDLVQQIRSRLLAAEVMSALKRINIPGVDFSTAKQFAHSALAATRQGKLGYAIFTAKKLIGAADL
ncbi:MAG: methyltransferase domain-containing protein [Acidobacteriaceae bacterium]